MNALPIEYEDDEKIKPLPEDPLSVEAEAFWNALSDRVLIQHENGAWSAHGNEIVFQNAINEKLYHGKGSPMSIMAEHPTWHRLHSMIMKNEKPVSHALLSPMHWKWGHHQVTNLRALAILTIWTDKENRGRGLAGKCVAALNERVREGPFPKNGYLVVDSAAMAVARRNFDVPLQTRTNKYEIRNDAVKADCIRGYMAACPECGTNLGFHEEEDIAFGLLRQCPNCETWADIVRLRRMRKSKQTNLFDLE